MLRDEAFNAKGEPPKNMVDANIKTDYKELKIIADIQRRQCGDGSAATAAASPRRTPMPRLMVRFPSLARGTTLHQIIADIQRRRAERRCHGRWCAPRRSRGARRSTRSSTSFGARTCHTLEVIACEQMP